MSGQSAEESPASGDQENVSEKIITELTRANGILKANISTLYRTARAEIARKNDRIAELQSDLDNILFKRMSHRATAQRTGPSTVAKSSTARTAEAQMSGQDDSPFLANETL